MPSGYEEADSEADKLAAWNSCQGQAANSTRTVTEGELRAMGSQAKPWARPSEPKPNQTSPSPQTHQPHTGHGSQLAPARTQRIHVATHRKRPPASMAPLYRQGRGSLLPLRRHLRPVYRYPHHLHLPHTYTPSPKDQVLLAGGNSWEELDPDPSG